jgi:hypothetical protein
VKQFYYVEENPSPEDLYIEGVVILNDFDTSGDLEGARVVIFEDSSEAEIARKKYCETGDVEVVFKAALDGHAQELSIDTLVKFYLANGM